MKVMPLEGVRVLDISSFYAAPFAATLLGDFGAEVIKVEPPEGDGMRGTFMWTLVGRNKKSVTLDLRQPEGCDVLKKLVATSDVLIDNYPANVLKKRGIAWEDLSKVNPKLIQVSVSCFGQEGPYTDRPGSGTIGEGFGGLTNMTGFGDGPPMLPSLPMGDAIGGMNTVIGTMMALYWRDTGGGRGQHIDASLFEPILLAISQAVARWKPDQPSPRRTGSKVPGLAVRNVYATSDGNHVVVSTTTQRHTKDIVALAGGTAATPDSDADALVAAWMLKHPLREVVHTLTEKRIPVATVNDIEKLLADPHVQARGSLIRTTDPILGEVAVTAPSPRLSVSPGKFRTTGSKLGEHNDEVFGRLLGLDAAQRAALKGRNII